MTHESHKRRGESGFHLTISPTAERRNYRAIVTALSSVIGRGLVALTGLLSIRLTLGYLGADRFGLWMTIASLQTVFALADIGLGYSVLHIVSEAFGTNDRALVLRTVYTGLLAQIALVTILLALFAMGFHYVHWGRLFHVENTYAAPDAAAAAAIFIPIILIRSVIQVVQQAQYGMQAGYIANMWSAAGNIASIVGLYFCAHEKAGVPLLCLTVSGLPVLFGFANMAWWLGSKLHLEMKAIRGKPLIDGKVLATLVRTGFLFFLLQLSSQLTYGIDPLIVNQVLGAGAVATLTVVQKPFDLLTGFLLLILQPLWPAYREAITTGDVLWIRRTFARVLLVSGLFGVAVVALMAIAGKPLIQLWAGSTVNPPVLLIYAYCAAFLIAATQAPLAFFLNGLGKIRFQLLLVGPVITVSIIAKIVFTPRFGLAVIPMTTVIVSVVLMVPIQIIYMRTIFRELKVSPLKTS